MYTVTVTNADGTCSATEELRVVVFDGDNQDQFPEEVSICSGESITLDPGGDPTFTYSWSPAAGIDDPTSASPTFSPTVTTVYSVRVTSSDGTCSTTEQLTVEVFTTDFFEEELSICSGESVTPSSAGDPAFTYAWSPTTGVDDPTSAQPTLSPSVTTVYTVTITDAAGVCTFTEQVTVVVASEIGLVIDGAGNICESTTTVTATTVIDAVVQFFDADGNLLATDGPLNLQVSGVDNFTAVATTASGCTETVPFTVSGGPVRHKSAGYHCRLPGRRPDAERAKFRCQ